MPWQFPEWNFPKLFIVNLGGGSQRSDFGMARLTHWMCPADVIIPTAMNRKYNYGIGFILPQGFGSSCVIECTDESTGKPLFDASGHMQPEELEWLIMNSMAGAFRPLFRMRLLDREAAGTVKKAVAFCKRIRKTLWGDRYVLAEPVPFIELENRLAGHREAGIWEAYQNFSPDKDQVSLFAYRCMSPETERTFVLRGLEPTASYKVESYSGMHAAVQTGATLMHDGTCLRLEHTRKADILLFTRLG